MLQGIKFKVIRVDGDPIGERMPTKIVLEKNGITAEYMLTVAIDSDNNLVQSGLTNEK
jgi:hypothetical protein